MSSLSNTLQFFKDFGLFDIILPFLLVFTLVFALLEKSKVLGVEGDGKTPKKNLNAMVAFVVGFLVVSTNAVVNTLTSALPQVVLLLTLIVSFLLLLGSFLKPEGGLDFATNHPNWYGSFVGLIFLGVVMIFLGAIKTNDKSWLSFSYDYAVKNLSGAVVGSVVILIIVILAIIFITRGGDGGGENNKKKKNNAQEE